VSYFWFGEMRGLLQKKRNARRGIGSRKPTKRGRAWAKGGIIAGGNNTDEEHIAINIATKPDASLRKQREIEKWVSSTGVLNIIAGA
jgi:hypothetical protein